MLDNRDDICRLWDKGENGGKGQGKLAEHLESGKLDLIVLLEGRLGVTTQREKIVPLMGNEESHGVN